MPLLKLHAYVIVYINCQINLHKITTLHFFKTIFYLPTDLTNYLPTYLPTYIQVGLPTYLPRYLGHLFIRSLSTSLIVHGWRDVCLSEWRGDGVYTSPMVHSRLRLTGYPRVHSRVRLQGILGYIPGSALQDILGSIIKVTLKWQSVVFLLAWVSICVYTYRCLYCVNACLHMFSCLRACMRVCMYSY